MTGDEIAVLMDNPAERGKVSAVELCIISILSKCYRTGEHGGIAWLLERACGKSIQAIEDSEDNENLSKLPTEELIRRAEEMIPELKKVSG